MSAPRPLAGSLATAVSLVLAAFALQAAFADLRWMPPVLGAALLVLAVGAVFRAVPALRRTGLAVVAQTIAGVLGVAALASPATAIGGVLPTPASFPGVLDALNSGIDDLYATQAPAASTSGLTALIMALFALVAVLIDGLVSDLHAPKPAGLLLLVIYFIPVLLAPNELRWYHIVLIGLSYLVLLAVPHLEQLRGGLPVAVAVAAAAGLAASLAAPLLLPPAETRQDIGSGRSDLTVVNPFLNLRDNLDRDEDQEVLRYTTTSESNEPLRLTAVAEFDGETWQPSPFPLDPFAVAEDGLPQPPGLDPDTPRMTEELQVAVTGLDQEYLPAPYPPVRAEGLSRRWIYDERSFSIVGNGVRTTDLQYTLEYLEVEPTPGQLRTAPPPDRAAMADYLALPDDLPGSVGDLAEEVTAAADTDYDRAVALQAHFRSGEYTYSLDAPDEASNDAIADFLEQRTGYCVQFASAMTVMARHLGIPGRIAVGFTAGSDVGDGQRAVTLHNAHAWPELYFEGVGWVRFEPSPADVNNAPEWSLPTEMPEEPAEEGAGEEETPETAAPEPEDEQTEAPEEDPAADDPGAFPLPQEPAAAPRAILGIGGGLLALLLAALPWWLRRSRRNRRLSDGDPRGLWSEVEDLSLDAGRPLDPADTLRRKGELLQERQERALPEGFVSAAVLAGAAERSRYALVGAGSEAGAVAGDEPAPRRHGRRDASPASAASPQPSVDAGERRELVRALGDVRRLLRAESGPVRRVLAALLPRSLWRRR
ncbi:transglutaminase TgpA family protein [Sediminivirga luteola]|uniref:Transglutaminase-like domain-containing protein n=1 Tax=Sediminivirga luteola TaxID=1774748 RepID=A0A8J2XLV3_9MICO|nr:DUF3488 and transglutaminase-like domain-containing protein [Sediminivirga luteola]GGA21163.1 hypothetical protein GCM10011333_25350 [Sediminivirga luteola]